MKHAEYLSNNTQRALLFQSCIRKSRLISNLKSKKNVTIDDIDDKVSKKKIGKFIEIY